MKLLRKIRALFRRENLDTEMDEELRAHLELQTAQNITRGMTPEEARYAAQRLFGHAEGIKETVRDQRGWRWIDQAERDFRYSLRQLRRSPIFTGFVLLTIAIGIGASTAIFSVVHALLLSPLQYHDPARLVQLRSLHPEQGAAGFAPAT